VATKAAERGKIGAVHQQGREEQHERQLRIERDRRQAGNEGQAAAADEQRGRGRPTQFQRKPVQPDDKCEQPEDEFEGFDGVHRISSGPCRGRTMVSFEGPLSRPIPQGLL